MSIGTSPITSLDDANARRHNRLRTALAKPWWPLIPACVALMLTLPAIKGGFKADDFIHRAWLLGPDEAPGIPTNLFHPHPWRDLFVFTSGEKSQLDQLQDLGMAPWWTADDLRIAFFRPLAALSHQVDYALWADSPSAMHVHSLLWLVVAILAAGWFYRQVMPAGVAGLAILLFALDDAHSTSAAWIANRNVLCAMTFGMLCLVAHHHWRGLGRRWGLGVAIVALTASLLSAEAGIGTAAYLAAYAIHLDRGPRRARWATLAPYAVVIVAWRVIYAAWGFGVTASGMYVDPLANPIRFLLAVVERAPVLLLAQWAYPSADIYTYAAGPVGGAVIWIFAVGVLIGGAWALARLVGRNCVARFWATGMVLAVIPCCAAIPMDRLLVFPGLGAFGLLALAASRVFRSWSERDDTAGPRPASGGGRVLIGLLLIIHLAFAPLLLAVRSTGVIRQAVVGERASPFTVATAAPDQYLIIVHDASPFNTLYLPIKRALEQQTMPRGVRALSPSGSTVDIRRIDANTLEQTATPGYLAHPLDRVHRGPERPLAAGDAIRLEGMHVEVRALSDAGRPETVRFTFDEPLESDLYRWVLWNGESFEIFQPPAEGGQVTVGPRRPTCAACAAAQPSPSTSP